MKVNFENHYNCCVTLCNEDDGLYDAPAPFEDINAALAYCKEEIDVHQQAISAVIWDALTGEVYATCGFDEEDISEEDYPSWDDDDVADNYPNWYDDVAEEDPYYDDPYDIEWDDHYYDYGDWDSDYLDDGCPIEDTGYLGEDGYALDDVDESNYDPYAGCDMYEVEPLDFGW